ncbi:serine/threonine-protein kinase [Nocardia otitidiscaviarum]|uniref:serine/threonine-protein kinase n=1 Tax=Nocardia otitidiscaviarum TaxID=1823 RepID=UPI001893E523|nr:serine/threonine-protein kinase [Nocardia otitidiscaviarum]MBF6179644.1 serine/threonine protein kinase [Nocardia otitidiscaviarum]
MKIQPLQADDPQHVGRYRVLGELGAGGMGRVLLGVGADGRLVAIKQVHPHLLDEAEYRARFRREVAATTRVSGAFTAPVIDFDIDSGVPWLASVFVIGMPLDKAVSRYGPLPPPAVRRLAVGLAAALHAIHQAGLVHRDLKPANVLLADDGPRVIDFGIASMSENPGGLTETGSVLGSPAYMSPEQTLAQRLTPASDVFSLGSVLMAAATGSSPFEAASLAYTLFNIAHTQPDLEALPPELRDLIEPCLHKDPAGRPTPAQILDYLGQPVQHELPWPEPVHHEIERQRTELAALAADPDATSVLPGVRRVRDRREQPYPTRRRRGRVATAIAVAVVLAVAMAVTATAAWVRSGDTAPQLAARELTLPQVREADTCSWLKEALGASVPVDLAQNVPAEVSAWQLVPFSQWGCHSTVRLGDRQLIFSAGDVVHRSERTAVEVPAGSFAAGQRIVGDSDGYGCERSVRVSDSTTWGLTVSGGAESCDLLEHILLRVLAVEEVPRLADVADSLASVDPCGLADPASLLPLIGPVPDIPSVASARSCEWQGSETVAITTSRSTDVDDAPVIELGDGRQLLAPTSTVDAICDRKYVFRQDGADSEVVNVRVHGGAGMNEQICATAESVARTAIDRLPRQPG